MRAEGLKKLGDMKRRKSPRSGRERGMQEETQGPFDRMIDGVINFVIRNYPTFSMKFDLHVFI